MSMLVNSMIDKFEAAGGPPPPRPVSAQPAGARARGRGASTSSAGGTTVTTPPNLNNRTPPATDYVHVESLRLQQEQERTRQEQLRCQLAEKNLEILRLAVAAQVPPHLIPLMCVGGDEHRVPPSTEAWKAVQHTPAPLANYLAVPNAGVGPGSQLALSQLALPLLVVSVPGVPSASGAPAHQFALPGQVHQAAPGSPNKRLATAMYRQDQLNASSTLPIHYRFGETGSKPAVVVKPPLTPQQPERKGRHAHSRTNSMPEGSLQLPLISSNIQVKPLPALAQNKPPPLQELMTLFQHVIQFHHWKPGDPSPPSAPQTPGKKRSPKAHPHANPNPPKQSSPRHKRYKLEVPKELDDETIDDTTEMSPQQAPPVKFPHDIIS